MVFQCKNTDCPCALLTGSTEAHVAVIIATVFPTKCVDQWSLCDRLGLPSNFTWGLLDTHKWRVQRRRGRGSDMAYRDSAKGFMVG